MGVVSHAGIVFFCVIISCCNGDVEYANNSKMTLIKEFTTSFLQTSHWSNIIILTDDQDVVYLLKLLSQNLIFANTALIDEFNFKGINNYGTVIIISKLNIAIEIAEKGLKSKFGPSKWLVILKDKWLNIPSFFIPHDVTLFLLDADPLRDLWVLFRLYSDNENVIKLIESGFWEQKRGLLKFSYMSVPLPTSCTINPLRFSTIKFKPFFIPYNDNKQLTIGGVHGDMMKIIREVFLFNISVSLPEDGLFGNRINDTYQSGIAGNVYRNESDVGISLTMTKDRAELVTYSPEISKIYIKIVYHQKEGSQDRFFFYLEPFSSYLWICTIGFTVLFAVLLSIITHFTNKIWSIKPIKEGGIFKLLTEKMELLYYYMRSAFFILLRTGVPVKVFGTSGKIFLFVFDVFCIILFVNYTSVLTSILAINKLKLPFENFFELIYNSSYDVSTLKDTSIVEILKNSKADLFTTAYKKMNSDPEKYFVKTNQEGLNLIYNRETAYLMEEGSLLLAVKNNCSFRFLDDAIMEIYFCFTYNKQFPYIKLFDKFILILSENGISKKLYRDNYPASHNDLCDELQAGITAIKMPAVVGIFFTLCVGVGIAIVVFFIEICTKMRKH